MRKVFLDNLPTYKRSNKQNINWKESIEKDVSFEYDNIKGIIKIKDYDGENLYVKYKDKENYKIATNSFKKGALGKLLDVYTDEFKVEVGQIFKDNKRDLTIVGRKYIKDKNGRNWKIYKYKCNICGWNEGWIKEGGITRGNGCSCCNGKTVVEGINDIPTTNLEMVKFFQGGYDEAKLYTKRSNKRIYPICPDCGRVKEKTLKISDIYNEHSIGCSCSDGQSYPNKFMFSLLEQLGINFKTEYNPEWIKPKRFDFYFEINKNNQTSKYIIEMDGGLGHGKKIYSNDTKTIEETLEVDNYKDKLAEEHGVEVIRINCYYRNKDRMQYIKQNIFNSKLSKLFNLSQLNWLQAEEFALSNLVKKVCEIKRENINMTTTEISKLVDLDHTTINSYLKKGNELGWCYYNPKDEVKKVCSENGKSLGKSVEIFKNGISLGIFCSVSELERQSEKRFGVRLINSCISLVCNNKQKEHKGYTFKYIEDNKDINKTENIHKTA